MPKEATSKLSNGRRRAYCQEIQDLRYGWMGPSRRQSIKRRATDYINDERKDRMALPEIGELPVAHPFESSSYVGIGLPHFWGGSFGKQNYHSN